MKVGIRAKLVVLLTLVGLLPLTTAVVAFTIAGRKYRTESLGETMQLAATAEALSLRTSLVRDIQRLRAVVQEDPVVMEDLARRTTAMPEVERAALDAHWSELPVTQEPLAGVMNGPVTARLRVIQQGDSRISNILLTDRFGQLVAGTGHISRYYVGQTDWWKGAYAGGQGRVFVPPAGYDPLIGSWSVSVCLPVLREGKVIGVFRAALDISRWMGAVERQVGRMDTSLMLVQQDGRIIYQDDIRRRGLPMAIPLLMRAGQWYGPIARGDQGGWRMTDDDLVQGFAPLGAPDRVGAMEAHISPWTLVMYIPVSQALGPFYRLSIGMLSVGIGVVAIIFMAGLIAAEVSVVRRIHRLEQATRSVSRGDLSHRIEARRSHLTGRDELDDLAHGFNHMLARVQETHEALRVANELKMNFIRIASHELRTPVSYVLGVTRLLKDSTDSAKLVQAMQNMAAKAKRLDDIIQAMFKLMPDTAYAETLHYVPVVVSEVLEEIYLHCFPFVEKRQQHLIVESSDHIPVIQADREKLYDIVENLTMNAIQFTPDGGTIHIHVGPQLGGFVSIAVRDQGPGIPEKDLPHIFEPFFGTADVLKHSSGVGGFQKRGIGLGLTIVKHFADLHGGTVHLSSTPAGCVFTVAIPIEPPPRP